MISDEMRELLSAYVDGELRDADAARVEDTAKRDPELRREIEAYRTLRRKLREWDAAEHAVTPSASFVGKALARARAMDLALATPARTRFLAPLAAAAALLVAVAAGYLLARGGAPEAPSSPEPGPVLAVKPLGPAPDLRLPGSALAPEPEPLPALVRSRLDDHLPSRRSLEFAEAMRSADTVRAEPPEPERRTGTAVSLEVQRLVAGYEASGQPSAPLVAIAHAPSLSALEPMEPARGRAIDASEGRIYPKPPDKGPAVVAPLGEVWMGPDRRVRLVAMSEWVRRDAGTLVPVVWADEIRATTDLEAQEVILGPRTRQRLLAAKPGPDAAFLAWLREAEGKTLAALLADGAKDRERAVNRLVDALSRSAGATGFAVLDTKGNLLGTELFHDRELMLAFAPRLLRGYLLEAGEDGIRVGPPGAGGAEEKVARLLDGIPGRGLKVEREALDVVFEDALGKSKGTRRAPDGVARVTLYAAAGPAVGHGLVHGDAPIHVTIFGE